jgi:hypothetical protein
MNEMWIATWNVRRLYRAGAVTETMTEMKRYKKDKCALEETG